MSVGELMYYGGMAGAAVGVLLLLLCLKLFPVKRRKLLKKLSEE